MRAGHTVLFAYPSNPRAFCVPFAQERGTGAAELAGAPTGRPNVEGAFLVSAPIPKSRPPLRPRHCNTWSAGNKSLGYDRRSPHMK